jgi:hypothetical protein
MDDVFEAQTEIMVRLASVIKFCLVAINAADGEVNACDLLFGHCDVMGN